MRKKLITRMILLSVAVAGTCLALLASKPTPRADSCNEEETMENCAKKQENGGGMIWENISHQFFSSF